MLSQWFHHCANLTTSRWQAKVSTGVRAEMLRHDLDRARLSVYDLADDGRM